MYKRKTASLSAAFVFGIAVMEYMQAPLWCVLLFYGGAGVLLAACFAAGEEMPGRHRGRFAAGEEMPGQHRTRFTVKENIPGQHRTRFTVKENMPGRHRARFALLLVAAAVCGSLDSMSHQAFYEAYESRLCDGEDCLLQGKIYQKKEDGTSCLYYLKKCRVRFAKEQNPCDKVLVYLDVFDYSIGEILCVKGSVKKFSQPSNEGGYDEKAYYRSQKIGFSVFAREVTAVYGRRDVFREWLWSVKEKMKKNYQAVMPEPDAGVLSAMVLGDKSLMGRERKNLYQNAGISHFYSISGLHISLLGMALYRFFKKRGVPYGISCAAASVWILAYGEMVGFGVSASRAIGMFLVLMYAKYRGRSYDRLTALALMAAVLAAANPGVLHHAGYLLSFGAVAGVLMAEWLLDQKNEKEEREGRRRLWEELKEGILVSFCIQLATLPILCRFFYEISVYTVLINLLILPCMGALLGFGVLGGVVGCWFPSAGKLTLYPCYLLLLLFDAACKAVLQLPYAVFITGTMSFGRILLWYGLLALFLLAEKHGRMAGMFLLCLPVPLSLLLLWHPVSRFEMDVLDVGQGDGIYIATGDGTSLFFDGGSTDIKNVGIYRILPFLKYRGIREMDYWFVSHCDADHISGLIEIMELDYRIRHLVVSEFMPEDEASQALLALAAQKDIPVLTMGTGDAIKSKQEAWACRCISVKAADGDQDRNANSLVLLYESRECSGFLGGDIGMGQEEALLAEQKLPRVDIYKASHHGSDTSNGSRLLNTLQPEIAVISCSLHNSYGHPGKAAVGRMGEAVGRIYETRRLGQIKITGVYLEEQVSGMLEYTYEDD